MNEQPAAERYFDLIDGKIPFPKEEEPKPQTTIEKIVKILFIKGFCHGR